MKKILALCLSVLMLVSLFAGCAQQEQEQETTPTEETPKVEDDGVMRILMIGGSLGFDT